MKGDHHSNFLKILIVALIMFATFYAGNVKAKPGIIHISGTIEGVPGDSVVFELHPYFSFFWQNSNASEYDVLVNNHEFSLRADIQCPHSYISAYLKNKGNYHTLFRLFLVTPSDSIHITVRKDTLIFRGRGAAKFICQEEIQSVPELNFTKKELLSFKNNTTDLAFNMYTQKKCDSLTRLKLDKVKKLKQNLDINAYNQIRLNIIADNLLDAYRSVSLDFQYDSSEHASDRNDKIVFYRQLEKYHLPYEFNDTLLAESGSAADYLLYKAIREVQFRCYLKKKALKEPYDPLYIAKLAGRGYGQVLKDKLLALSFYLHYRPQNEKDTRKIDIALSETKSSYFYKYLVRLKTAMAPGTKAFNFTLFTPEGKEITLDDFEGKAVVLDFWFRGCGYCAFLEKRMKNIRRVFLNDSAVVFISVNLDKDKDQFLKGIASGKYTGENEINL